MSATIKVLVQILEIGELVQLHALEHEGGLWLVPAWSEPQAGGKLFPMRLIRMDKLRHQKMNRGNQYGSDYVLYDPMPKGIFEDQIPQGLVGMYDVIERPNFGFRVPTVS